jgi:hypothetical protein
MTPAPGDANTGPRSTTTNDHGYDFVRYQYSGMSVSSGLKTTPCTFLLTAITWAEFGIQMYGSCSAAYVAKVW